ncbi:MAG: DUF368 domain-containing protein [Bdellovibrionales bacterium]
MSSKIILFIKGFCMGMADIVPGVSGGTVAFITGIYDDLIASISSVNKGFVSLVLKLEIKKALKHINIGFLLPLFSGIIIALISMANLMHYFMDSYPIYTWSLFFGLILASIVFVAKTIEGILSFSSIAFISVGTAIGYLVIQLVPVDTPNTSMYVFFAGCISICAMILPGISGSFLLLILGKYFYITSAIKAPTHPDSLPIIVSYVAGALVGILSFSKLLNFLLNNYRPQMMCVLVGFMIGSIQKIWPWREVIHSKVIGGKTRILEEAVYFPTSINQEALLAFGIMIFAIALVFSIEKIYSKS